MLRVISKETLDGKGENLRGRQTLALCVVHIEELLEQMKLEGRKTYGA
jgi:hypothetical protein